MQPGPPPKPTRLKVIEGNPGKRALNRAEPKPAIPATLPDPPDFLSDEAKAEWHRRVPELHRLGIFTSVDVSVFAAYCAAYARWRAAEIALVAMGDAKLMILTAAGNAIQNPMVGIAARALEQMSRLAAEFGMTPSGRGRISAPDNRSADPLAHLLNLPTKRA